MDSSYLTLDWSISNRMDGWLVLVLPYFIEIPVINANCVDPDQTLHSAASDLSALFANVLFMGHWA